MKVNIEINFDEVNYDEIEEVEDLTLYDTIDEWIGEPIYDEGDIDAIMKKYAVDEDEELHLETEDDFDDETVELPDEWIDAEVLYELQDEIKQRVDEAIIDVEKMFYYGEIGQRTKTEIMELFEYILHGEEDPEL